MPTIGANASHFQYGDFHYGAGEHAAHDYLQWDDGTTLDYITHEISSPSGDEICRDGDIVMKGKHLAFTVGLDTFTIGNQGNVRKTDSNGIEYFLPTLDGDIIATLTFDPLPSNFVCYSASGAFPQCEPCRYDANPQGLFAGYSTIEGAAEAASIQALQETDVDTYEYGGNVYPQCGSAPQTYGFTYDRLGKGSGSIDGSYPAEAGWHTHENGSPLGKIFSTVDINWTQFTEKPLYMAERWDSTFWVLPANSTHDSDKQFIRDFQP